MTAGGHSHHVVYIDESGNGGPAGNINSFWVAIAVLIPMDERQIIDADIGSTLKNRFRPYAKEIRGSNIPHHLLPGQSLEDVASDVAALCDRVGAHIWGVATRHGKPPPSNFPIPNPLPKDIVRQFLMERINGFFQQGYLGSDDCIIVWDISDHEELRDFSASVAAFRNAYDQTQLCPRLAPAVLGGLSHDWKGLQIADIIANFALHHLGRKKMLPDAKKRKADAFEQKFYPRLQKNAQGVIDGIGWKVW